MKFILISLFIIIFINNKLLSQDLNIDSLKTSIDSINKSMESISKSIESIYKSISVIDSINKSIYISDSIDKSIDSIKNLIDSKPQYIFYSGLKSKMSMLEIASLCAPVFWYSPDEPELHFKSGKEINIPRPYPFEKDSKKPVVYYDIKSIRIKSNINYTSAIILDSNNLFVEVLYPASRDIASNSYKYKTRKIYLTNDETIIELSKINGFSIYYTHYYENEKGLGIHLHDNEQVKFDINVVQTAEGGYKFLLYRVKANAHNNYWYDNVFTNRDTSLVIKLPFHILVEEGKHASCTDVNGDGYYSPGYDVNNRTNDAWGIRDVISTGTLFDSDYQSWMSKVRKKEHKVIPPLPTESPYYFKFVENKEYSSNNAVYELRPMPPIKNAIKYPQLSSDMQNYIHENIMPEYKEHKTTWVDDFIEWANIEEFINSYSFAARYDGTFGVATYIPLFLYRNVDVFQINGKLVHRLTFSSISNDSATLFGYSLLYTPSVSRFIDTYFAAGFELGEENVGYTFETGIKLRFKFKYELPVINVLGIRLGLKGTSFNFDEVNTINYIFEIGFGGF